MNSNAYYVSPEASGTASTTQMTTTPTTAATAGGVHDGKTWSTAWRKLSDINWSIIKPGDTIILDGGAKAMVYSTGLYVQKDGTPSAPISIVSSTESGHNGQVVISGKTTGLSHGIDLNSHSNVIIAGNKWKSIRVTYFKGSGVYLGSASQNDVVQNLEVDDNKYGIAVAGAAHRLAQIIVHDNALNISASLSASNSPTILTNSWVSNYQAGTTYRADGVAVLDTPASTNAGSLMILNSVIGPGLSTGINVQATKSGTVYLADCLLLNAEKANLSRVKNSSIGLDVLRLTSFMTHGNYLGQGHAVMQFTELGQDSVRNSVIYGGVVRVTGTQLLGNNNVQYKTEGHTTLLSASQVNPNFNVDVSRIPNMVPVNYLSNLDFGLKQSQSTSTVQTGVGSQVTSVRQLLSSSQ